MTEQDTGLRRRESDFKLHPEYNDEIVPVERRSGESPRRYTTARSFLRRFRQPIIGLSLAGVAAPLINASSSPGDAPHATAAEPTEADLARQATQASTRGQDAEEQLAGKIAQETHATETASFVDHAVEKYDIDPSLATDIYEIAQKECIEPKLAFGLVRTESSFKTHAQSGVGARGLTQVMPKTAKWLKPGTKAEDLYDQKTNLTLGFKYLNQLIDKYNGNVRHALLAYNRGPGTVDKILKRGGNPNNGYADKVLGG